MKEDEKRNKMKGGGHPFFIVLSLIGVLIGISLVLHGMNGGNLGSGLVIVIGLFVAIKEILDIFH